ncbi:MAG: right-handed parallel beta-helix repeat-containing protein [Verrucomicrobia bacterium]|nr:right-handed parallel beta-helix repeat-containing protein [Verrucomicrobiota bacterium]
MTNFLPSKIRLQRLSLLLAFVCCLAANPFPSPAVDFYVATNGNDTWSGTLAAPNGRKTDGPFATLERARDELRKLKVAGKLKVAVTVHLRSGFYPLEKSFALSQEDSGTEKSPVVYRAYRREEVRLVGGKVITGFKPVTDTVVLNRLEESARGKVLQADLKAIGISDLGEAVTDGKRLELFFADQPMTLARWPNDGFVRIVGVVGGEPYTSHGIVGDKIGKFTYDGDRPKRWAAEKDFWLHGYWFWDWSDSYEKVESIDADKRTFNLTPPYHGYGYRKGQRYYALNLLAELDAPGEWYLDRQTGILYFWPPSPLEKSRAVVSVTPTLLTLKDASWVTFRGLTLEATRGTAVTISGGTENRIVGCTIRNTGGDAVSIAGGTSNSVVGCDIYQTAGSGISLDGGDRKTLTPAGHSAENNHIHNFGRIYRTYRPAVNISGVGNRVVHNLMHDAPHEAIQLSGNDHFIEFNEIHSVCYETGDVGAFYMGRDWTMRGTVIRNNYFHDIRGPGLYGAMAVYLDDATSGITVYGNVFYRAGRAAFIGGGRDNLVENNIFVECQPSVHVDARGLNWMRDTVEGNGVMPQRLKDVPYQDALWRARYPQLPNILNDEPGAPKGNTVARNVSVGGKWLEIEKAAEPLVRFEDNLVNDDPRFVDAARLNFQLRKDSPAWKLGFKPIPIQSIGVYKNDERASWPVVNQLREK